MSLRIGVIGAGTAGLAAAIALARQGHAVRVYEKHPTLATLGAGVLIQPQGVRALAELGVGPAFEAASVPIDRLIGLSHRGWPIVDVPYRKLQARAVSRTALAKVLFPAAQDAGAQFEFGADMSDAGALDVDLAIIANGASSTLATHSGLAHASEKYSWGALWGMFDLDNWPSNMLQQRFDGTRKMFGIMPTEWVNGTLRVSFFWSLPVHAYPAWRRAPLRVWKEELLQLWPGALPLVDQIVEHDQFSFATYYHARPSRLAAGKVCIIGDAAHAMSPQLGLGSTLAVQDALALAQALQAHGPVDGPLAYSRARLPAVRAYQMLSRALTPCFQRDGAGWWRDALFGGALYVPGVQALMVRSLATP